MDCRLLVSLHRMNGYDPKSCPLAMFAPVCVPVLANWANLWRQSQLQSWWEGKESCTLCSTGIVVGLHLLWRWCLQQQRIPWRGCRLKGPVSITRPAW